MNRYCIWLTFDSEELRDLIIDFARKYNSPIFQPHITLLGRSDVDIIKLKSAIYNLVDNFDLHTVKVRKFNFSDDYFRSYFIEINEKQILTNLHKRICDFLNIGNDNNYLPHISLMYNNISKEEKKQIILPFDKGKSFKIRSIQITACDGDVENWKPIFELNINN